MAFESLLSEKILTGVKSSLQREQFAGCGPGSQPSGTALAHSSFCQAIFVFLSFF